MRKILQNIINKRVVLLLVILIFFLSTANITKPAQSAVSGQIMVDPNSNSWLVYNRDSDGDGKKDPHFMCAPGDPEGFLYRGSRNADGTRNGDQMTLINKLQTNLGNGSPANGIYMQIVRSHGGDGGSNHNPFVDSDPSRGLDQDILNQWETWFTEMDNAEITIYLFFWDDNAKVTNWGSYSENQFYTDIVNKFEGYKNLIWVFAEEYQERWSSSEVKNASSIIRTKDNNNHPIAVHKLTGLSFSEFATDPNIDQFSIQYKTTGNNNNHNAMITAWNNAQGRYNLNLSEPKNIVPNSGNRNEFRQRNWAVGMAGAYIMNIEWNIDNTPGGHLRDCGNMVNFMEQTTFNEMGPNDSLASSDTDYVLANPGSSYIVYTNSYNSGLGLKNMTSGTYDFLWYDINNNNYVTQNDVGVGSGTQQFSRPSGITGNEIAVYLSNTGIEPSLSPTPPFSPTPTSSINQPPITNNSNYSTPQNQQLYIQLTFSDSDGPGPYTYTITTNPSNGTLSGSSNDRTYTPNSGFTGTDSFQWKVNDGLVDSNIATVTIMVGEVLGDANGDQLVDGQDFIIWFNHYGQQTGNGAQDGDFSGNNFVNYEDFIIWINSYRP